MVGWRHGMKGGSSKRGDVRVKAVALCVFVFGSSLSPAPEPVRCLLRKTGHGRQAQVVLTAARM